MSSHPPVDCGASPGSCCWVITNCQNIEEQYQIQLDAAETNPIYLFNIYKFAGDDNLYQWSTKCFRVDTQRGCDPAYLTFGGAPVPIVTDVTIITDHGPTAGDPGGCALCNPCHEFEDCLNPGTFRRVRFLPTSPALGFLTIGNVYSFFEDCGGGRLCSSSTCLRYNGEVTNCVDVEEGVGNIVDRNSTDCLICLPCLQFRNCDTNEDIFVKFSNQGQGGLDQRQIDKITLSGSSGSINIQVGSDLYPLAFNTDLTTTAADFVSIYAATILGDIGVIVTSVNNEIFLESALSNYTFGTGAWAGTGDLSGFAEDVQLNDFLPTGTPTLLNVYDLQGDPAIEGVCWQFRGEVICDGDEDYSNITIKRDYECANCPVCLPHYELTNCADPNDTLNILWDRSEPLLDETAAYIFDFAPDVCYTPRRQFPLCEYTPLPPAYTTSNIVTTYVDCADCNRLCYRLVDCESFETIEVSDPVDMSVYVGKVIKWKHESAAFAPIERCGLVEEYVCRTQTYNAFGITILECAGETCEECLAEEPEKPFSMKSRPVQPGYDVPDCTN